MASGVKFKTIEGAMKAVDSMLRAGYTVQKVTITQETTIYGEGEQVDHFYTLRTQNTEPCPMTLAKAK